MAEYIDRDAFKAEIRRLSTHYLNEWDTLGVLAAADRIPAADVVPVRHGRWISEPGHIPHCSECGKYSDDADTGKAICCPFCGANMKDGELWEAYSDYSYNEVINKLATYEDAEEQGRLVILPCNVGDTVWTLNHHYRPVDGKVRSIHQNYVGDRAGRWVLTSFFPEYYGQAESGLDPDFIQTTKHFGIDDFGKTVFLTRTEAEAEAALKGERKDV